MRHILDTLSVLTESTGLAGRTSGDIFKNPDGDEIVFNDIKFYPEAGGKYSPEEMDRAVEQVNSQVDIKWLNHRTAKNGGFALASFTGTTGPMVFGRYLVQISPVATHNYIPNTVEGYRLASKSAVKMQSVLTPQDVLTNKIDLTSEDILSQLREKFGEDSPLYQIAESIASGAALPIEFPKPEGISFTAFRDHFCEILQPMALQVGSYTGNAGEAAEIFLGGDFGDTKISFDLSKTAGLSDSIMTKSTGEFVKISTKGSAGAYASSKNLIDSVNELEETDRGRELLKKHEETIDLLNTIKAKGQLGAPLYLGVKYDVISEEDADTIRKLRNLKPIDLADIEKMNLGDTLTQLALRRKTETPESTNLFYHLMAAVASKAADKVNRETNFSNAAADILNNGALIQVYTKMKEGKETWTLQSFDTVFPGESIKGVFLTAGKTYYSTGIKGNFTFRIDKGAGIDKSAPIAGEEDSARTMRAKRYANADVAAGASTIVQKHALTTDDDDDSAGAGRQKRQ